MKKTIFVLAVLGIIAFVGFRMIQKPAEAPTITNQSPPAEITGKTSSDQTQTTDITIKNFAFSPAEIEIKPGTKVIWTNQDSAPHRIEIGSTIKSPNLSQGASFESVFSKVGEYSYICGIHPSMKGKISVGE